MPNIKFKDIYHILKNNIDNGSYDASMMLPTEMELVDQFKCSRNTIQQTILIRLSKDGYVKSVKGKGVIILESRESIGISYWKFIRLTRITPKKEIHH